MKKKLEFKRLIEDYDNNLRVMIVDEITKTYFKAMQEADKRDLLSGDLDANQPRVDYFLQSIFYLMFEKMHRGDRYRAIKIIEEMRQKIQSI